MKPIRRRAVLRGAGGIMIGMPLLEAMLGPREILAATAPQRFIVVYTENGTHREAWLPTGGEANFTLSPILEPLAPHQTDLVAIAGLNHQGEGGTAHAQGRLGALTGLPVFGTAPGITEGRVSGASLDQMIATQIGENSRFRSIEFAVGTKEEGPISAGRDQPLPLETDPSRVFARLFGDGGAGANAEALARLRARKRSILDSALVEFERVSAKVGASDRLRLAAHADAIRTVERSLDKAVSASCVPPAVNAAEQPDLPTHTKLQIDLLVAALSCGLTQVGSLSFMTSGVVFDWLGHSIDHHTLAHDAAAGLQVTEINRWFSERLAYLITSLKALPEPSGGTLFDNTLILWVSNMAIGQHPCESACYLLAGGAGGRLKTGRFLRYGDGTPHNNLLVSVANLMGIETSTIGKAEWCTGPLAGLVS